MSPTMATYDGEWVNGKQHGEGVLVFKDGSKMKGTFKQGKPHGDMVMTHANGILNKFMTFKDGKVVSDVSDESSDLESDEEEEEEESDEDEDEDEESP